MDSFTFGIPYDGAVPKDVRDKILKWADELKDFLPIDSKMASWDYCTCNYRINLTDGTVTGKLEILDEEIFFTAQLESATVTPDAFQTEVKAVIKKLFPNSSA